MSQPKEVPVATGQADQDELSDEQLDSVAGGDPTLITSILDPARDLPSGGADNPNVFMNIT